MYKKIGTVLGGKTTGAEKAAKVFKKIRSALDNLKRSTKSDSKLVRTAAYLYIDNGSLMTVAPNSWEAEMLSYTGAVNVFGNAKSDVVDPRSLTLADPDYIFVSDEKVSEYLSSSETYSELKALENNTFVVSIDNLSTQGNTIVNVVKGMISDIKSAQAESESEQTEEEPEDEPEEEAGVAPEEDEVEQWHIP